MEFRSPIFTPGKKLRCGDLMRWRWGEEVGGGIPSTGFFPLTLYFRLSLIYDVAQTSPFLLSTLIKAPSEASHAVDYRTSCDSGIGLRYWPRCTTNPPYHRGPLPLPRDIPTDTLFSLPK